MKNQTLVISIILNTNRREDTLECLSSLQASTYENLKIILLDNASSDGSVEAVRSLFPEVQIIRLQANLGYAGNNNVGIEAALDQGADWIFVLNEDTVIAPDCIEHLVRAGESDAKVGIVGPTVYHHDEPEVIQSAGAIFDRHFLGTHLLQNETERGQYRTPHPVDWISGCGIMVRDEVIREIGALDERFFYYVEEAEWCVRTKKAGWEIVQIPFAKLWHKGVRRDYRPNPTVTYYATRNRLLLIWKHKVSTATWFVVWILYLRTIASWTLRPKWRSMNEHRNAMLRGIRDFLRKRWGPMPES